MSIRHSNWSISGRDAGADPKWFTFYNLGREVGLCGRDYGSSYPGSRGDNR